MRVPVVAFLVAVLVGCDGTTPPDTEVRILIDVAPDLAAQLLNVRVFDTDRRLARERIQNLEGVALPIVVPLFPDGEGARSFHVVLQLLGPSGAELGTQRVIGTYVEGQRRVIRVVFRSACADVVCSGRETCRVEADEAACVSACFEPQAPGEDALPEPTQCSREVYVDGRTGRDEPGRCFGPEAPCATVAYALANYLDDGMGGVIQVAGGSTYDGFGIPAGSSGTVDVPTVVQAWPGTGRPVFDGRGEGTVIGTCCSENAADHFVLDGLEVTGGFGQGIQLHGRAVRDAVIRNCVVRDTRLTRDGANFVGDRVEVGGIVVRNDASGVLVQGNTIRNSQGSGATPDGRTFGANGISVVGTNIEVDGNLVVDSSGSGVLLFGGGHRVTGNRVWGSGGSGLYLRAESTAVEDNRVCGAGADGIEVAASHRVDIHHNSVVRSQGSGAALRDSSTEVSLRANLFALGNAAGLMRLLAEGSEPMDAQNLYWMNAGGAYEGTTPDGMDWVDVIDPMFVDVDACGLRLGPDSSAATLIDGGPVGSRLVE